MSMFHKSKTAISEVPHGNKIFSTLNKWLLSLGPSVITAALVFGPGSLTITSRLGATYGYSLLWVVILATALMIAFTLMGARIGLATGRPLLEIIGERWGRGTSLIIGIGFFYRQPHFRPGILLAQGSPLPNLFIHRLFRG